MQTNAVLMRAPGDLGVESIGLQPPRVDEVVVDITHSGISTGTENLLWTGRMPSFPGMGYPLVPGYESVGEVVEAGALSGLHPGDRVFVPGADCYEGARGLFGGAASRVVVAASRVIPVDAGLGPEAALLALAATARHTVAGLNADMPQLIVGHGVMGRLLARIVCATGAPPPVVWELDPARRVGETDYLVIHPDEDRTKTYDTIFDVSGDAGGLDRLIGHLSKGGEIVLAGFYPDPINFAFPPAFMKEARLRIAAEWTPQDMLATRMLVEEGYLSLDNLITHMAPAQEAATAYVTAFEDPSCLKMILDWKNNQ